MKVMTVMTVMTMITVMTIRTVMTTISDHHGQPLPIQSTWDRSLPRAQHTSLDQSNLHDYHWDLRQGDHHDCHGYGDTCAIVFSPYQKIHLVWSLTQRRYRDSSNVYVLIIILVHAFLFGGLPDDLPMFWMHFPGISHSPSFFLRLLQSSSRSSDTDGPLWEPFGGPIWDPLERGGRGGGIYHICHFCSTDNIFWVNFAPHKSVQIMTKFILCQNSANHNKTAVWYINLSFHMTKVMACDQKSGNLVTQIPPFFRKKLEKKMLKKYS